MDASVHKGVESNFAAKGGDLPQKPWIYTGVYGFASLLRISPRSYSDLKAERCRFSMPSLIFLMLQVNDSQVLELVHELRAYVIEFEQHTDVCT